MAFSRGPMHIAPGEFALDIVFLHTRNQQRLGFLGHVKGLPRGIRPQRALKLSHAR